MPAKRFPGFLVNDSDSGQRVDSQFAHQWLRLSGWGGAVRKSATVWLAATEILDGRHRMRVCT